jgi:energy-coupling factor transporter ATP-binding protein EcfA2
VVQALQDHLAISLSFRGSDPILDGYPLTVAAKRLSTGQKYLLDFWVRVLNFDRFDEPTLILMDEPELHVHPAALIPVFSTISEKWTNSQIFVATHCVPLVARLGFERVLWVKLGRVQRARNVIDQLLTALLGGDGGIERLQHLTLEPDRLAALTFAAECILPPKVLEGEEQDPQANQLRQFLGQKYKGFGKPVRLLDWGAGRARLLRCLGFEEGFDLRANLSYVALDKEQKEADAASLNIADVFGSSEKRLFIELCNVLHEIHPDEWLKLFSEIKLAIGDGGFLLIIEDGELPHGEQAHRDGFLLLDGEALQALFQLSNPPERIMAKDAKYADRLLAFVLAKEMLNPTHESVAKAIGCVRQTSLARLEKLKYAGYHDGSIRSLYVEQFYNASRLLIRLGVEPGVLG